MGNRLQKWVAPDPEAAKAKMSKVSGSEAINYDEPVARWHCCYFFLTRPLRDGNDDNEEDDDDDNVIAVEGGGGGRSRKSLQEEAARKEAEAAAEAKAKKMAQILYFQEDMDAERRKNIAFKKMLEVKERQALPMSLRMYKRGYPAPLEFTTRCMRQEARLGLCTTLENFLK